MPAPYDITRIHTLAHVLTSTPPPILWDIDTLLARNERMVMYGEFASLKSWLLMSMTLAFATGTPWLNTYPTTPRSVLYFDEENHHHTATRRFQRLYAGLGSPPLLQPVHIASRLGVRVSQSFPERFKATLTALSFTPDVIIVETLRRVLPGKEVEQSDISAFWTIITSVLGDHTTCIVAHHMRKANRDAEDPNRDRASGSTDILAGCDVAFAVERISKGNVKIECVKSREVEEPDPFGVVLDAEDTGPASLRIRLIVDPTSQLILDTIRAQTGRMAHTAVLEVVCKQQGVPRPTLFRRLKNLVDQGLLTNPGHGVWVAPPPPSPLHSTNTNNSAL